MINLQNLEFNEVKKNNWINSFKYSKECLKFDLKNIWRDHYLTNPIARSSSIMAELSKNKRNNFNKKVK